MRFHGAFGAEPSAYSNPEVLSGLKASVNIKGNDEAGSSSPERVSHIEGAEISESGIWNQR